MTVGVERHKWKRPAVERDLFDYLICLGFATVWFDKRLISEVMREDKAKRQAVRDEIDKQFPPHLTIISHEGIVK